MPNPTDPSVGPEPTAAPTVRSELEALIREIKHAPSPAAALDDDYPKALCFDSLDFVELAARLDTCYGVEIGAEVEDLRDLARLDTLTALVLRRRRK